LCFLLKPPTSRPKKLQVAHRTNKNQKPNTKYQQEQQEQQEQHEPNFGFPTSHLEWRMRECEHQPTSSTIQKQIETNFENNHNKKLNIWIFLDSFLEKTKTNQKLETKETKEITTTKTSSTSSPFATAGVFMIAKHITQLGTLRSSLIQLAVSPRS
jgi:hypothetical protein